MIIENLGNLTMRVNGPEMEEYSYFNFNSYNIPYDGSVSLHFITKIDFDLTAKVLEDKIPYKTIIHNTGEDITTRVADNFEVTVPDDGYYEISTLILPTTSYIEDGLGFYPGSEVIGNIQTNIIAAKVESDGEISFKILTKTQDSEKNYYSYIWAGWQDISLDQILELVEEAEESDSLSLEEVTVLKYNQSAFIFDNLFQCYISKAMDLLSKYSGDSGFCASSQLCPDGVNKYKSEIQIRDYLWMAINVIKYCIQNCQYLKALQILNCVTTCSGICAGTKINNTKVKSKGCGCGK